MAVAWCINAYDCSWCLIRTLECLQSSNIGVGVQYCAPNPLDDKRIDYIQYTDKCWCTCCLSWENEILIYATDWVIKNLTLTNDDVNEAIKIKWNDIFWSNRAKTIVRYKTGSAPVSITDGTLAVEETVKNQYSSTPFSLTGVLDETTYYITAFAVDSNNTVISSQTASVTTDFWWHPSANTLARYKLENDSNDYSWNGRNWTASGISYTTISWIKCPYFNYSSNSYISLPWFWTLNSITVSFWINSSYSWTQMNTPFSTWPTTDNANFQIYAQPSSLVISRWNWSDSNYFESNYDCTDWTWHNVVATNWSDWAKIYIDWIFRTSSNNVRVVKSDNWRCFIWHWVYNNVFFLWYLSNVIIENKVWTSTDVSEYWNKIKSKYWI